MVCVDCGNIEQITDVTDMPPFYCPTCGGRRHVEIDAETPEETVSDTI